MSEDVKKLLFKLSQDVAIYVTIKKNQTSDQILGG